MLERALLLTASAFGWLVSGWFLSVAGEGVVFTCSGEVTCKQLEKSGGWMLFHLDHLVEVFGVLGRELGADSSVTGTAYVI